MVLAFALALSYLLGSIPFAVLVSRALGLPDPRSFGSGNPGATNVLRGGSRLAAAITLVGDSVKGSAAVWLGATLATHASPGAFAAETLAAAAGFAAFLGHLYPCTLGFAGGKGVATAAGVLLALSPPSGLVVIVVWIAVAALSRYASLAGVVAALAAVGLWFANLGLSPEAGLIALMAGLLIWRHRENVRRLFAGTESKIGRRAR
jgi:glycerol-3-phosphate acyltransferase PlsY